MGINILANSSLGSISSQFFFPFFFFYFFFKANMNLTVFAGILLAVTMATARRASLGEKTMQAAGKADEPDEAMREVARPASLVEKIKRAVAEADAPDEAKRESFDYSSFESSTDPCEIYRGQVSGSEYRVNACVNGTAYGCTTSKLSKGKA